jgi:GTPase SAR1 family protein
MPIIDSKNKEINFKIVYFGPARSGKTTSVEQLNKLIKAKKKSSVKKN